jgi:hypothetical protein
MMPATTPESGRSITGPAAVRSRRREARLRPEHAHRYPGLHAEEWVSGATLADRVLAGALRGRGTSLWVRLLRDEHFEFRGGGCVGIRKVTRGPAGKTGDGTATLAGADLTGALLPAGVCP